MISLHENVATAGPVTVSQIEENCRTYEAASAELDTLIASLESDLEEVKKKHIAKIKRQAGAVANLEAQLHSQVESAPDLFKKPRTMTVHGIKTGFATSQGKLEFDDEATVIKLIKKFHPKETDLYIRTTEEVNKDAVKTLDADALKRLGCKIEGAGDVVVLKRVAGEVEKLINKLINKLVEAMVDGE